MTMLTAHWPWIATGLTAVAAVMASLHAVFHKRDSRAAVMWVGLIWFLPVIGASLYLVMGVNRIQRRAQKVRANLVRFQRSPRAHPHGWRTSEPQFPPGSEHLRDIVRVVDGLTTRALCEGNRVAMLVDGDRAYPAMLAAIAQAESSVTLSTYIFDRDPVGLEFVAALAAARRRGCEVRVLIDDLGARYTFPSVVRSLRREGVPTATFLPVLVPWRVAFLNLRNHRKCLVVDGRVGFTGGMNIRAGHVVAAAGDGAIQDVQFRVDGPAVAHLQEVFAEDWSFATGELLSGSAFFPSLFGDGPVAARGITDGPDEEIDNMRWTILAALGCARRSVRVVTPYFLPDSRLIAALNLAAMRGVEVDIVLPERSNLRVVQWASQALLWQVLENGCRVWLTPPPFDHSKLMVVDDSWTLVGSTNWDPRALRLNFELNLECYDVGLATDVAHLIDDKRRAATRVTQDEVDRRPLPIRLRDNAARLFTPYL